MAIANRLLFIVDWGNEGVLILPILISIDELAFEEEERKPEGELLLLFEGVSRSIKVCSPNKRHQPDSRYYAIFVLLAIAQTLTQKWLRTACSCGGRYISGMKL